MPGGKRWFVKKHRDVLPEKITGSYIEPFLGSGAVFFAIKPDDAIVLDACKDLIVAYRGVRNHTRKVLTLLTHHAKQHAREYSYHIRVQKPRSSAERAARLIYRNRTCFYGIYSVDAKGKFNSSFSLSNKVLHATDNFSAWSKTLKQAHLLHLDFENVIDQANRGDFLFVDPPYTTPNNTGAIRYTQIKFSSQDQLRLHDCLLRAKSRGARMFITNAHHPSLRELYSKGFKQFVTARYNCVAGDASKRGVYEELVIQG